MPASYKAERPLTRSEYAKRRDQTTKEELAKLKSTPEYKNFAKTKGINEESSLNTRQLKLPAIIATLLTALLAVSVLGKAPATENVEFVSVAPVERPTARLPVEQQVEIQQATNADLEYSVLELTSHLKSAEIELYAAQKENNNLLKTLELEQNKIHTYPSDIGAPVPAAPAASLGTLQYIILGALGLITSVVASIFIANRRNSTETSKLRSENLNLTSQLQELAFEKDMAEQSISILESELQRKMSQLAEAQCQYKKPATPMTNSDETPSPRIRAVQQQKAAAVASPTPLLTATPTTTPLNISGMPHSQRSSPNTDSLPPPPRQLVERFLEERGAIAIEQEQVQAWLEMESHFGQLQREVKTLRALVEGRAGENEEQKRKIEELNQALEEQKEAAKKAKAALKAVRAAGNLD